MQRLVLCGWVMGAMLLAWSFLAITPSEARPALQVTETVIAVTLTATPTLTATVSLTLTPTPTPTSTVEYRLFAPIMARVAPGYPTAPQLSFNLTARNMVTLTWDAVANARSYHLQRSHSSTMSGAETVYSGLNRSYVLTLAVGTHYFHVQAVNQWGATASNVRMVAVVPPSPTPTPPPTVTPTPPPIPITCPIKLYLSSGYTLSNEPQTTFTTQFNIYSGSPVEWTTTLGGDLNGNRYEFGVYLASLSTTTFREDILVRRGQTETLLASTTITVSSTTFTRYVRRVDGIDPATVAGDVLVLRINNVDSFVAGVLSGPPDIDSYILIACE